VRGPRTAARIERGVLRQLTIRNLALIDSLEVEFGPGLNLLTGETGSGKSIIVDSLGLALGERATPDQVRSGTDAGVVEAVFDADAGELAARLEDLGCPPRDGQIILARELSRSGRSSARANGRAIPLATLRGLGEVLVDVHGQREHQGLLQEERFLAALDRFGGDQALDLRQRWERAYQAWIAARERLALLTRDDDAVRRELELLEFQLNEIEAARLTPGEDDALVTERETLRHSERLRHAAQQLSLALRGDDDERAGATVLLDAVARTIAGVSDLDPRLGALLHQLEPLLAELDELSRTTRSYIDSLQPDPERLAQVEERLDLLTRLKHKYGATLDDVVGFAEQARQRLPDAAGREEELARVLHAEGEATKELAAVAPELSRLRQTAATALEERVVAQLAELNMLRVRFTVAFSTLESPGGIEIGGDRLACSASGIDHVALLLAANPGEPLLALERVGSGGEISRVMLALRTVLADADRIATVVLDEVDVGIGGATAVRLGEKLRDIGRTRQVICVTHLASVAAVADCHLSVRKQLRQGRHLIAVEKLEGDGRVKELARLLAGGRGGAAALQTARQLLGATAPRRV